MSKVPAHAQVLFLQRGDIAPGGILRLGKDNAWKDMRQVVLADDDLHIDTEGFGVAEHLDDAAASRRVLGRELGDLHVHGQAVQVFQRAIPPVLLHRGFRAKGAMGRGRGGGQIVIVVDQNRLRHALIQGRDIAAPKPKIVASQVDASATRTGGVEDADHRRIAPRQHADDASAAAAVPSRRRRFHQDLVALHGAVQLMRWDKDVAVHRTGVGRADKAKAIAVQRQFARDQVRSLRSAILGSGTQICGKAAASTLILDPLGVSFRERPVFCVKFDERPAHCHPCQLFQQ